MNANQSQDKNIRNEWYRDRSNWKLGIFYFNSKDKRTFPPKRFGIGRTINFANPRSVLLIIGMILIAAFIGYFFK